jgi:hypothetical protein
VLTGGDRAELGVLMFVAAELAVVELLFLPLRFDGIFLPDLSGFPLPVAALVAALANLVLVRRAGQLSQRGIVAGAPMLTWLFTLIVFGIGGPGGDMVLLADWRTLLLLGGGGFPAAWMLGGVLARASVARALEAGRADG